MKVPQLRRVLRLDSIKLDETYFTEEGYLIDHPIVTSCGIFEYTNPDGTIRRELRLPEHVFAQKSLDSYEGKPIIITHDAGVVDKNNVDKEIIGTMLSKGYQDGDNVRVKIVIHDTDRMKESGLRELSLGYNLTLDETPGVWNGQPYDAIQKDIEINHLALVANARAGEKARLNIDGQETKSILKGGKSMSTKTKRKDGGSMTPEDFAAAVEAFKARRAARNAAKAGNEGTASQATPAKDSDAEPAAAPATSAEKTMSTDETIQMVKDRRDRRDQEGDPATPEAAMGIIAQQDEDIETLLEIIEALKAEKDFGEAAQAADCNKDEDAEEGKKDSSEDQSCSLNMDAADALFRTRLELVRIGDRLNIDGIENMPIIDAKKAIIKAVNPQMRLDGKGKAYINAAFDLAKETLNARKDTNYQRSQMFNADSARPNRNEIGMSAAEKARARMIERKQNGGNR
ncbi:DUF2213 domain-containing protein [Calorimonas adulescens]|uniref:DUF2213 domain-containing protein n=1 Tax=Calorimonas adulescens TaxID=2606906 RepID=A0A5D8QJ67_9THEO|nr:DUF2213 domain-containing protein [Calorimonas adulescens]TZE83543.1 DUF2213 domain-containing protein [Calorimonas adulescens]